MDKKRPLILVTNDDGHAAKGLCKLVTLMRTLGDVVLISTDEVMSAKSHSCSIHNRIYAKLVREELGFKEFRCNGSPSTLRSVATHAPPHARKPSHSA